MLTQKRLKELLNYDPETGVFTWKVYRNYNALPGDVAGSVGNHGYAKVSIDGKSYLQHRIAWLYMNGYLPNKEIDHKNNIRTDNRLLNLREATHSENQRNSRKGKNNKSGLKGVCLASNPSETKGRYYAYIGYKGKQLYLGRYRTAEEAHKVYCKKALELHGDFAKLK